MNYRIQREEYDIIIAEIEKVFETSKISPGEMTTGLCFTENNKHLITVTSRGCIFFWKLPGRMIKNMNK